MASTEHSLTNTKTNQKKFNYRLLSGSHEAQGPRKTMEDTHKRIDDIKTDLGYNSIPYSRVAYYAVYDGHGGAQTAEMVVDSLHPRIFGSKLFEEGDIVGAIHKGFQEMDQLVVEEANKLNSMHGCTCVCSIILDDEIYFANIGDSEGILISVENGVPTAKNMTKAHKANEPSEKERIESLGGHVFFGRVYGSLAVSRSFGDAKYKRPKTSKDFVTWEPFTITETLSPNHKYMVLACDGLFDVMTHQEVADFTHNLFASGHDPTSVAKSLVIKAVKDLSTEDNVTVIVVKIVWEDDQQTTPENSNSDKNNETTTQTESTATPERRLSNSDKKTETATQTESTETLEHDESNTQLLSELRKPENSI
jgi:serine/threonine protein phosphatase PrpC